jgi:YggT family protein
VIHEGGFPVILATIARVLNAAVIIYIFLCAARVLMSWVPGLDGGKGGQILARAADPYLNWFRRFKVLRSGAFDFSPIAALAILAVVNDLLTTVSYAGSITVGLILALLVGAAWSAVAFIISFFLVCAIARMIAYAVRANSLHPLWKVVDSMLNPVLFKINRLAYRNRIVNYLQGLITGSVVLLLLRVGGGALVSLAMRSLERLPF